MKILKYLLLIISVFYLISGLAAFIFANFTIGSILCILLGIVMLCFSMFNNTVNRLCRTNIAKILKLIVLTGCIFALVFSVFLEIYGSFDNIRGDEDAIIILGAAVKGTGVSRPLKYRLDAACEFLNENPEALAVVTGGRGFQEEITEAEAMKNYLVAKGIEENRIIKEEKATSTYENFKFSKEILDAELGKEYKTALVTNNFHVLRSESIGKKAGINCTHIGAKSYWLDLAPSTARETLAYFKHLITGK